jgi:hypothetical protein
MKISGPTAAIGKATETMLDRVLCVLGAVAFSQGPEFMQQYLQRLGGHLSEARRHLFQFETVALRKGQSVDQYAANLKNTDMDLGQVVETSISRVNDLAAAEAAIRGASPFGRPFVFVQHLDNAIASDTWSVYKPAVPTTTEGLLYAAAGIVVLLLIYHLGVKYPVVHLRQRWKGRRRGSLKPVGG